MLTRIPQPAQALQHADATLRPLMQSVRTAISATPVDLAAVKASLIALFAYLSSPTGRTDANCCAVEGFFYLDDDLPLERLSDSLQNVFAHMDSLSDTISDPHIAKNFDSTPEQLLERVRNSSI
jgi:hypothetical protein